MARVFWLRFGLKFVQLVLACACISIFAKTNLQSVLEPYILEMTTYGGYVVIVSGFFVGYLVSEHMPRKMDLMLTVLGGALFVVSGSVRIHGTIFEPKVFNPERLSTTCGALAIVNGFFFAADTIAWFFDDVNEYTYNPR